MLTVPNVFVLAAPHFDEVAVVTCLSMLRGQGITAVLLTPTPGLISGKRGITLRPDFSLAQVNEFAIKPGQMGIIAGGTESAANILTDPRTHQLLQQILAAGGLVAGMRHTCQFVQELGLADDCFLEQGGEETAVFIQQLIDMQFPGKNT